MAVQRRNGKSRNFKRRQRANKRKRRNSRRKKSSSFHTVFKKVMKLSPSQRIQAMKLANNKFISDMSRQVKKLRHARVSPKMQKRLKRQSKNLRKFTNRKTSIATKRRMLTQQRGGFLPLLLAALPAVGGLIRGIFGSM